MTTLSIVEKLQPIKIPAGSFQNHINEFVMDRVVNAELKAMHIPPAVMMAVVHIVWTDLRVQIGANTLLYVASWRAGEFMQIIETFPDGVASLYHRSRLCDLVSEFFIGGGVASDTRYAGCLQIAVHLFEDYME